LCIKNRVKYPIAIHIARCSGQSGRC